MVGRYELSDRARALVRDLPPDREDQRSNPRLGRATYRRPDIVERPVGRLEENRRLATRPEKPAVDFLAMVELVMIQRCLRALDSWDAT